MSMAQRVDSAGQGTRHTVVLVMRNSCARTVVVALGGDSLLSVRPLSHTHTPPHKGLSAVWTSLSLSLSMCVCVPFCLFVYRYVCVCVLCLTLPWHVCVCVSVCFVHLYMIACARVCLCAYPSVFVCACLSGNTAVSSPCLLRLAPDQELVAVLRLLSGQVSAPLSPTNTHAPPVTHAHTYIFIHIYTYTHIYIYTHTLTYDALAR